MSQESLVVGVLGAVAGFAGGYVVGKGYFVKPKFENVIKRYSIVTIWQGERIALTPVFIPQESSGDELWLWLAPDRGILAATKMWARPDGVSFETARLAWAEMLLYRQGQLVATFPEITQSETVVPGYYSTVEPYG